jgi:DNA-binding PadR family transcriptional regulator
MKYALLALLAKAPAHGYELKQAYESLFGAVQPPLNAGQIYTTLSRLERDHLVQDHHVAQDDRPDKRVYRLTGEGEAALREWFDEAVRGPYLKDEFFTKLIVAKTSGAADPAALIQRQRVEYLQSLRALTDLRLKNPNGSTAAVLLIEGAILHLQADLKWLDLCEERML